MASLNASSSKTTLWATASKEWVIQPKPKPGRKPKKDLTSPSKAEIEQADTKGRRIQNRAAQRAFRERKQSQLSDLQARIQSYEQGEIERNVALQNVAKRLKEENENLRHENQALQARILQMEQQSDPLRAPDQNSPQGTDKKRWRDESPSSTMSMQPSANKKLRTSSDSDCSSLPVASTLHLPSPSSTMVSTPESNDTTDSHFSSLSYDVQHELDSNAFDRFNDLAPDLKDAEETLAPFPTFGCGFCDDRTICVCHEIAVQQVADSTEFKSNGFSDTQLLVTQDIVPLVQPSAETARPSILNNLPAYQPPVALRRRSGGVLANSVFPVQSAPDRSRILDANCSGDPSNCLACGDDAFGKAFCAAIEKSTSMETACDDCPSSKVMATSSAEPTDFMPTNDAWRKIKAHPNVEFADLSLLAEVVSSRSKCSGPRLLMSPAPQFHQDSNSATDHILEERKQRGASPPPRLVPQEVLLECGRRRLRQVHADGVREALRMLDAKFS